MYEYRSTVIDVYDGDTVTAILDLGFKVNMEMAVRLYGIQTPEVRTKDKLEKEAGLVVAEWVRDRLLGRDVRVKSQKDKAGKFGRFLLDIYYENDEGLERNINAELIQMGYALPYHGEKKKPFTKKQLKNIIEGV